VAATETDRDGLALLDLAVLRTIARGDLIVAVDGRPARCTSVRDSDASNMEKVAAPYGATTTATCGPR